MVFKVKEKSNNLNNSLLEKINIPEMNETKKKINEKELIPSTTINIS
jgi:hypothetical protein